MEGISQPVAPQRSTNSPAWTAEATTLNTQSRSPRGYARGDCLTSLSPNGNPTLSQPTCSPSKPRGAAEAAPDGKGATEHGRGGGGDGAGTTAGDKGARGCPPERALAVGTASTGRKAPSESSGEPETLRARGWQAPESSKDSENSEGAGSTSPEDNDAGRQAADCECTR